MDDRKDRYVWRPETIKITPPKDSGNETTDKDDNEEPPKSEDKPKEQ